MKPKTALLFIAGILGFLCVLLGATGKHALQDQMNTKFYSAFETGLRYHQIHSVVLLALALSAIVLGNKKQAHALQLAGFLILLGILVFSGSLYLMAFWRIEELGRVTPVGGILLMLGWLAICRASFASEP
jgi:uncharacterized membrane protein YgdD (TMEM256/DUF423 family)